MQYRTLTSIGLALLLVTSMSGVGFAAPLASANSSVAEESIESPAALSGQDGNATQNETQAENETEDVDQNETEDVDQNETEDVDQNETEDVDQNETEDGEQEQAVNISQLNLSALDAIQLAQEQVQGKAIDVELGTQDGNLVYSLAFIEENRSVTGVLVDVSNRSVIKVAPNVGTVSEQDLGAQAFNFSQLRAADEAIRFAQNVTTGTVVEVELSEGALIYRIETRTAAGGQEEVIVAAAEGPILSVQSEEAAAEQNETQEGNETEEGGQ